MQIRIAATDDLPVLRRIMHAAIEELQHGFLTTEQIAASHAVMGLDSQLIADGTYLVAELDGRIVGCGGWSRRATLYGGDASAIEREPQLLDPGADAARVRAMYTDPAMARRGIGRALLDASEDAARQAGFRRVELMATLSGEPLYLRCGYRPIERIEKEVGDAAVPLVRMGKSLV